MDPIKNIEELLDVLEVGILDISECKNDLNKLDESNSELSVADIERLKYFGKRNYVRTVFASIESILFAMKRIVLEDIYFTKTILKRTPKGFISEEKESELRSDDIIYLQEYKFVGPNTENLKKISVSKSFEDNVKFAFRKYEQTRAQHFKTDFGCEQWKKFKNSIEIRNRITHPKLSSDLKITDNEFKCVEDSYHWFNEILNKLQEEDDR